MRHFVHPILLALFVVSFLLLIAACGVRVGPPPTSGNPPTPADPSGGGRPLATEPSQSPAEKAPVAKPDAELTLAEYDGAFSGRGPFANPNKYMNQFVKVHGKVNGYFYGTKGECYLLLDGSASRFACEEKLLAAKALPGQTVTLCGKPTSVFGVERWAIVDVTGPLPHSMTAEQLLQDLTKDKAGTDKKLNRKVLLLSGQIAKVQIKTGGQIFLTAPDKQPTISCWFYSANNADVDRERLGQFKVGQK
jgi:hypothetical protein